MKIKLRLSLLNGMLSSLKQEDVLLGRDDYSGNYILYLKKDKRFTGYTPSEVLEVFDYFE